MEEPATILYHTINSWQTYEAGKSFAGGSTESNEKSVV